MTTEKRKKQIREWRKRNLEAQRKRQREWQRQFRKNNPEKIKEYDRIKHQQRKGRDPIKSAARTILNSEIKSGRLVRPDKCSKCDDTRVQAHHEDYTKPLEVIWLCQKCHALQHYPLLT